MGRKKRSATPKNSPKPKSEDQRKQEDEAAKETEAEKQDEEMAGSASTPRKRTREVTPDSTIDTSSSSSTIVTRSVTRQRQHGDGKKQGRTTRRSSRQQSKHGDKQKEEEKKDDEKKEDGGDDEQKDGEKLRTAKGKQPMTSPADEIGTSLKKLKITKEGSSSTKPTVYIQHSTHRSCNELMKAKAVELKAALTRAIPGIEVKINARVTDGRRGRGRGSFFEAWVDKGEVLITLENLRSPFQQVKDMDIQEIVETVRRNTNGEN